MGDFYPEDERRGADAGQDRRMWGRGMGMDIFFERVSRNLTNFVSCHCSNHLIRFSSHVAGVFRMRLIPLVFFPISVETPHFVVYGLHLKPAAHITNGKSAVTRTRTHLTEHVARRL